MDAWVLYGKFEDKYKADFESSSRKAIWFVEMSNVQSKSLNHHPILGFHTSYCLLLNKTRTGTKIEILPHLPHQFCLVYPLTLFKVGGGLMVTMEDSFDHITIYCFLTKFLDSFLLFPVVNSESDANTSYWVYACNTYGGIQIIMFN